MNNETTKEILVICKQLNEMHGVRSALCNTLEHLTNAIDSLLNK